MEKLVRIFWKSILTFDGIVFCSSVGAFIWFSLLKKFPLIDIDASIAKIICQFLFILFTIVIVLNVLLGCIIVFIDMWYKSDDDFEQGGLNVGTSKSEQIPFTRRNMQRESKSGPLPIPPKSTPRRNRDGASTKPTKQ